MRSSSRRPELCRISSADCQCHQTASHILRGTLNLCEAAHFSYLDRRYFARFRRFFVSCVIARGDDDFVVFILEIGSLIWSTVGGAIIRFTDIHRSDPYPNHVAECYQKPMLTAKFVRSSVRIQGFICKTGETSICGVY